MKKRKKDDSRIQPPVSVKAEPSKVTGWTFLTNHTHVLLCLYRNPKITLRDLPMPVRQGGAGGSIPLRLGQPKEKHLDLHLNEQQLIEEALKETGGNVTKSAIKLGISRRTLHRKIKEFKEATPPPA